MPTATTVDQVGRFVCEIVPFSPSFVALEARLWRDEKVGMRGGGIRGR